MTWFRNLLAMMAGCCWTLSSLSAADDRVEFNRDIRPILSDNCFACHGPDEKTRQAGLRLDLAAQAHLKLESGKTAIVAGRLDVSELVRRIEAADPNEQMPPADSGKHLTPAQINLLKRWIEQGSEYQAHWSFVPVQRPTIPQVRHSDPQPRHSREGGNPAPPPETSSSPHNRPTAPELHSFLRNPIDNFVLARLAQEGLHPTMEADRERLLRRVTLDLAGRPPSIEEMDEFLADTAPDAFEKVVDRLLSSAQYGERMALDWLDAARYADTHGFNNDTTRYMWRWRDWTIDAFNRGLPFDQFIIEQLAGDLLPEPTLDQRIATGFNRNHVINSEGGIIPEEYRVEYVADRVHTTATILMGVSLSCARCHDHKFDPFTQREYYQFFAFFNNLNEQGEAGRVGNAEPTIKAPTPEQSARQQEITRLIGSLDQAVQRRTDLAAQSISEWEPKLREVYAGSGVEPTPLLHWPLDETTGDEVSERIDPARKGRVSGKAEWTPGKLGGAIKLDGKTHIEAGDFANFERTDKFSYGAWVNVATKDAATIISRMDDADAHRGFDLLLVGGKLTAHLVHHWPDNALHVVTKSEVPINQWKHVCATYDGSSLGEGLKLYVDGKLQEVEITNKNLNGTTRTTKPLRIGRRTSGAPCNGLIDDVRIFDRELSADEVSATAGTDGVQTLLDVAAEKRSVEQTKSLVRAYLNRFDAEFARLTAERASIDRQRIDLEKSIPTAMVMQEMPQPRKAFILKRGQYDLPTDEVQPDTPASLPPFPSDAPRNRLGLARWMFTRNHPLTSRVAVNRVWNSLFGTGMVETVEDFGSQGDWPTHLSLLDWLSAEFQDADAGAVPSAIDPVSQASRSPWDLKRLHRLIVTSGTYRQSSRISAEMLERDPNNKLLARGPRFRFQAEMIRDSALEAAGLLSDRIGGPSVSPYQPAGLWDDVAVGADYEGTVYRQDKGEGLYRRSMYTFWKRTCPPPGLNTFDAPEREVCTARRSRTNTPLQALVLMNDPTYLEAARKLGERVMLSVKTTPESRIEFAFRLALSRKPIPAETELLLKLFQQRLSSFQQDLGAANALLSVGESPRDNSLPAPELAAWTSVLSVILNLDEAITKS
jgi:mono/diheme cytochrome c family protein